MYDKRLEWKKGLAIVGAVASCTVVVKVLRVVWLWAELALGPVRVERYKGDWALVTGGSEGVGRAVASVLASKGLHIILVSRSQTKLDAAAKEIRQQTPTAQIRTIAADLAKAGSCKALLQQISSTPISVLIANLGGGIRGPTAYWEYTDDDEQYTYDLNGQACYALVKGLLPGMIDRNKGAIVAVSSIMHKWGAYSAPYGAEKAKINALMTALDSELHLAGSNVTAQAMVLGPVDTPGVTRIMQQAAAASAGKRQQAVGSSSEGSADTMPAAIQKPAAPNADAVAAAMVRCIGKGGPVMTPYWGHALLENILFGDWLWLPALQRSVGRILSRRFKETLEKGAQ